MCRNIKPLFNFEPSATDAEIHEAALQFVRKISGSNKPSMRNKDVFDHAVRTIAHAAHDLLVALETTQPPRNREEVAAKARAKSALRFGPKPVATQ
ncbi:DUF2277 domain-containing protein [Mesorhizobium sp. NPDC059054]|uniref:DUF2277 domain-containing protein n=1 Tax=Mesorhizobium sp. NPDC059054 TaxID=3346711 RepID=UPI0036A3A5A7